MEQEAAAIEDDGGHAGLLGSSGDVAADLLGRIDIGARVLRAERRSGGEGLARGVVDDLRVDVLAGAVHRQAGLATRHVAKRGADATAAAFKERELCHLTSSSLPCGRYTRRDT